MKKLLLIALLSLTAVPAQAQETNENGYVELPGNAYYRPGEDGDNVYIYRRYGRDEIYRRLINPYAEPRDVVRNFPTNDFAAICGNTTRESQRRRCRDDVMDLNKDRGRLYRKYN